MKVSCLLFVGSECTSLALLPIDDDVLDTTSELSTPQLCLGVRNNERHIFANVLIVDQPLEMGIGLAEDNYRMKAIQEIYTAFGNFMKRFYDIFKEFKDGKLFIAGENLAGIWIPYITNHLNEINVKVDTIFIGNSWLDLLNQYPSHVESVKQKKHSVKANIDKLNISYHEKSEPVSKAFGEISNKIQRCITQNEIKHYNSNTPLNIRKTYISISDTIATEHRPICEETLGRNTRGLCNRILRNKGFAHGLNASSSGDSLCCKASTLEIDRESGHINLKPSFHLYEQIMEKTKVVLYAGDQDLIANYTGYETVFANRNYTGNPISIDKKYLIKSNGVDMAYVHNMGNLSYAKIYNASNMTFSDKPKVVSTLFNHFINNQNVFPVDSEEVYTLFPYKNSHKINKRLHSEDSFESIASIVLVLTLTFTLFLLLVYIVWKAILYRVKNAVKRTRFKPIKSKESGVDEIIDFCFQSNEGHFDEFLILDDISNSDSAGEI